MPRTKSDRCPWCGEIVKSGTGVKKIDAEGKQFFFHKKCVKEHAKFLKEFA